MAARKRILYLIDSLGRGGAERLLVIYLQHLDQSRYEPRVCALQVRGGNPVGDDIRQLGIPVDLVPVRHLRDLRAVPRLWWYLRQQQIDVLHTQLEFSNTLGTIAGYLRRIPRVCTLHLADEPEKGSKTRRRIRLMWWVLKHFCDGVIAVSEETRQFHLRVSGDSPEKVLTIYNGIDVAAFGSISDADQSSLRAELNISPAARVLTTVCVLRPQKGIQFLIAAMPAIVEQVPDAVYLIVGDGDHRETLETCVREQGMQNHVIFAGFRQDVARVMAISDVFVLPTLGDALPTVVAEAMAAGKPVIASSAGGVPEMVADRISGLLVPPGDVNALVSACVSLLQDQEQAHTMGLEGRRISEERFNIPRQVDCLEAVYERLLTRYGK
jgi:glycosyltransferase involved in cell wall biosynthesis